MKKILDNQKGITLVEILAAVVIMGIVSVLIFNIQAESNKQYKDQLSENVQLRDVSYVLKVMTKEMRKTESNKITSSNINELTINTNTYTFDPMNNSININGQVFAKNIKNFTAKFLDNAWQIEIIDEDNLKVNTNIVVRGGS
ncbi:PulJ/GspJ family protein [Rummeliibacillus sp. JY-2-4R]